MSVITIRITTMFAYITTLERMYSDRYSDTTHINRRNIAYNLWVKKCYHKRIANKAENLLATCSSSPALDRIKICRINSSAKNFIPIFPKLRLGSNGISLNKKTTPLKNSYLKPAYLLPIPCDFSCLSVITCNCKRFTC